MGNALRRAPARASRRHGIIHINAYQNHRSGMAFRRKVAGVISLLCSPFLTVTPTDKDSGKQQCEQRQDRFFFDRPCEKSPAQP